jgi:hypothetical protein
MYTAKARPALVTTNILQYFFVHPYLWNCKRESLPLFINTIAVASVVVV